MDLDDMMIFVTSNGNQFLNIRGRGLDAHDRFNVIHGVHIERTHLGICNDYPCTEILRWDACVRRGSLICFHRKAEASSTVMIRIHSGVDAVLHVFLYLRYCTLGALHLLYRARDFHFAAKG